MIQQLTTVTAALLLTLACSAAYAQDALEEDSANSLFSFEDDVETGRLAFVNVGNSGITITFNATSVLGALGVLALGALAAAAVAAAIAIPLGVALGIKKHYFDDDDYSYYSGGGYGGNSGGYGGGSGGGSSYSEYAKRSLEVMSPVMKALYGAYQKYNGQEESETQL